MPDEPRQKSGDLAPRTLLAASVAGALATAAISGAGLAGSLIGGAAFPVIITLARELMLRAVDRAPRPRIATPGGVVVRPVGRARRIRWRRVAVTAGAAIAIVVSTYTAAEFFLGESVVSDRRTTFFNDSPAPQSSDPAAEPEAIPQEPGGGGGATGDPPLTPTTTAPTATDPATTGTAPETEPVPPAGDQGEDPATTTQPEPPDTTTAPVETTTAPATTSTEPVPTTP